MEDRLDRAANAQFSVAVTSSLLALTGCGAGANDADTGGGTNETDSGGPTDRSNPGTVLTTAQKEQSASRFLGHAAWGGNPTEIDQVFGSGKEAWLNQQLALPIQQTFVEWLVNRGYGSRNNSNASGAGMMPGLWRRLISNPDAVRQRIALALSEFFVCSADKMITGMGYNQFAIGFYWDVLEKNAFGNFRHLLEEVTLSPAMGIFLNTKGNQKADEKTGRKPDQNYAREVMQLFTIGLIKLNPDGTELKDAYGNPVETFSNEDVEGLSKVFTGWNFNQDPDFEHIDNFWQNCRYLSRPMKLTDSLHSTEEKKFLGTTIARGTQGLPSLKLALDKLFDHANTGPFFAKQMIQRLVTSNPSPSYVQRVATTFANNGHGVRGDLNAVFKAILLDKEARQFDLGGFDNSFGKLREPMVRLIQWARTFSATTASDELNKEWVISNRIIHTESELGQAPMYAPSVFNYFRPGYKPPNSMMAAQGMLAPEFQILTEPAIVGYVNFMQKTVNNAESLGPASKPVGFLIADYSTYINMANNPIELINTLTLYLAPQAFSDDQKSKLATLLSAIPSTPDDLKKRVYTAVLLIMCAPDYLIQR